MRVFVTGCAGFLGSHLCDALLERGHAVAGVDNLIGGEAENVPRGVDWYVGDCNDFERLKKKMRACEVVVHCAATAHEGLSVFSPHENAMHGYAASAAVFSAACAVGARRVVHCSSMARYGKGGSPPPFTEETPPIPEDPYGIGKLASEKLLANLAETHGMEWCVLVPHNIYGERQFVDPFRNVVVIFANLMLQGRQPYVYGDGKQERCFSHWSDDIPVFVRAMTDSVAKGQVFNVGPDEEVVTILSVAERIASYLGFPLDPIFRPDRPREVKHAHCSADKARQLLGYKTTVSLDDGIARTVDWLRKVGPKPFRYTLDLEIESPKLPQTWSKREM